MSITNYIQQLKEWSGYQSYTMLYNHENEELSSRIINSKIQGKKNIYFIIEDFNGNLFGSYHSFIPSEKERMVHSNEDPNHFIFTLKNPYSTPPQQFKPNEHNNNILYLYQDYDINNVLNIQYCYGITSGNKVFLYENIIKYYENLNNGCCTLIGNANCFIEIQHFIIIEMK